MELARRMQMMHIIEKIRENREYADKIGIRDNSQMLTAKNYNKEVKRK